ncbi:MAG TPA: VapC toxin family PIN domain ribonuclease [Acidobacteria bacterium]|nr:VapC toxin family PIN domain ribonuclease [Acidobacteriota bacterium]
MYLLDTDILIDVQRGYSPAVRWFSSLPVAPSVPVLVIMELIQDAQDARQVHQVMKLVAPLPVVSLTETDCLQALSNFSAYHLSHGLGLLDSLIAACAVGRSAVLCTFNKKHYRMVPDLETAQPYVR